MHDIALVNPTDIRRRFHRRSVHLCQSTTTKQKIITNRNGALPKGPRPIANFYQLDVVKKRFVLYFVYNGSTVAVLCCHCCINIYKYAV